MESRSLLSTRTLYQFCRPGHRDRDKATGERTDSCSFEVFKSFPQVEHYRKWVDVGGASVWGRSLSVWEELWYVGGAFVGGGVCKCRGASVCRRGLNVWAGPQHRGEAVVCGKGLSGRKSFSIWEGPRWVGRA